MPRNFVQNLEPIEEEVIGELDVEIVWDPDENYSPAEMHGPRPNEYDLLMIDGVLTPVAREGSDWLEALHKPVPPRPGAYADDDRFDAYAFAMKYVFGSRSGSRNASNIHIVVDDEMFRDEFGEFNERRRS